MKRGRPKTSTKVQWKRWVEPWQIPLLQQVLAQPNPLSPMPEAQLGGANPPEPIPRSESANPPDTQSQGANPVGESQSPIPIPLPIQSPSISDSDDDQFA